MTQHAATLLMLIRDLFDVKVDCVERTYKGAYDLIKVCIEFPNEHEIWLVHIDNEDTPWEVLFFDDEGNLVDNDFSASIKEALGSGAKMVEDNDT